MALIDCPSCGHKISDRAVKCPKCGIAVQNSIKGDLAGKAQPKLKKQISGKIWIAAAAGVVVLGVVAYFVPYQIYVSRSNFHQAVECIAEGKADMGDYYLQKSDNLWQKFNDYDSLYKAYLEAGKNLLRDGYDEEAAKLFAKITGNAYQEEVSQLYYETGKERLRDGNFETAEELFAKVIGGVSDNELAELYFEIGEEKFRTGDFKGAAQFYLDYLEEKIPDHRIGDEEFLKDLGAGVPRTDTARSLFEEELKKALDSKEFSWACNLFFVGIGNDEAVSEEEIPFARDIVDGLVVSGEYNMAEQLIERLWNHSASRFRYLKENIAIIKRLNAGQVVLSDLITIQLLEDKSWFSPFEALLSQAERKWYMMRGCYKGGKRPSGYNSFYCIKGLCFVEGDETAGSVRDCVYQADDDKWIFTNGFDGDVFQGNGLGTIKVSDVNTIEVNEIGMNGVDVAQKIPESSLPKKFAEDVSEVRETPMTYL